MSKIDYKRELSQFYKASAKTIAEVDLPAMRYLMVDGRGDPGTTQAYADAIEALFSVSYTAKFMVKRGPTQTDYAVMPLEGLWWADDPSVFITNDRTQWQWTMMIMQPELVSDETIAEAMEQVAEKKDLPALPLTRLEVFTEGRCAQVLHKGPFTEEGPTIERLHEYIQANGELTGKHHEIYLSDIRRAKPANWKTVIRQPMRGG
jgi:hypothetical protein